MKTIVLNFSMKSIHKWSTSVYKQGSTTRFRNGVSGYLVCFLHFWLICSLSCVLRAYSKKNPILATSRMLLTILNYNEFRIIDLMRKWAFENFFLSKENRFDMSTKRWSFKKDVIFNISYFINKQTNKQTWKQRTQVFSANKVELALSCTHQSIQFLSVSPLSNAFFFEINILKIYSLSCFNKSVAIINCYKYIETTS